MPQAGARLKARLVVSAGANTQESGVRVEMCLDLSVLWSFGINDGRLKNCVTDTLHIPHSPDPRSSPTAMQSVLGRGRAGRDWAKLVLGLALCLAFVRLTQRQKALLIGRLTESGCGFSYSHVNQSNTNTHPAGHINFKRKTAEKFAFGPRCRTLWQSIH